MHFVSGSLGYSMIKLIMCAVTEKETQVCMLRTRRVVTLQLTREEVRKCICCNSHLIGKRRQRRGQWLNLIIRLISMKNNINGRNYVQLI